MISIVMELMINKPNPNSIVSINQKQPTVNQNPEIQQQHLQRTKQIAQANIVRSSNANFGLPQYNPNKQKINIGEP